MNENHIAISFPWNPFVATRTCHTRHTLFIPTHTHKNRTHSLKVVLNSGSRWPLKRIWPSGLGQQRKSKLSKPLTIDERDREHAPPAAHYICVSRDRISRYQMGVSGVFVCTYVFGQTSVPTCPTLGGYTVEIIGFWRLRSFDCFYTFFFYCVEKCFGY